MDLIVLGTGNAMATRYYNTCFALRQDAGTVLVDAGGGNGILRQLSLAGVSFAEIRHMILTHAHCDHLLGAVWVVRKIGEMIVAGEYPGDFTIHCHASVREALTAICRYTIQRKVTDLFGGRIAFLDITDGAERALPGAAFTFFDILSEKMLQFGFSAVLPDGKKLCCLGDEPYNPACAPRVAGCDWLLCEAFCLYRDRERISPYKKHHSTVREACALAEEIGAPHLVVWHTEDQTFPDRKALYAAEGQAYYRGDLRVPDDLEIIALS